MANIVRDTLVSVGSLFANLLTVGGSMATNKCAHPELDYSDDVVEIGMGIKQVSLYIYK